MTLTSCLSALGELTRSHMFVRWLIAAMIVTSAPTPAIFADPPPPPLGAAT